VLAALPAVLNTLPVTQSSIAATDLLGRILHSRANAYSGYAESTGGLSLPVTSQFGDVADLFGDTTQLRVWWRGATDWRVDTIDPAGESDVHTSPRGTWTWDYEANRATWTGGSTSAPVRLPTAADMLPTTLAQRLLSQADPSEVSRLPAKRVAGRSVPGLRLTPDAPASTITHVDVWADPGTGLALRVDVAGDGASGPVVSSRFLDFSTRTPPAADTAFVPPRSAQQQTLDEPDMAAEIDQFGDITPPRTLAGLHRNAALPAFGSIGVYGIGVTELAAVPLPARLWFSLTRELADTATKTPSGLAMTIGPLSLLLANPDLLGDAWLLTGTVTAKTLSSAATQLRGSGR
jgi:hypothetical protein